MNLARLRLPVAIACFVAGAAVILWWSYTFELTGTEVTLLGLPGRLVAAALFGVGVYLALLPWARRLGRRRRGDRDGA